MFSEKCNKYSLSIPDGQIIATYIWVDENGENFHFKYRTLNFVPETCEEIPLWMQYDSTCNLSDESLEVFLRPCAMYRDPFQCGNNLLVLCEVFNCNDKPVIGNHRAACREVLLREEAVMEEPCFQIEQGYSLKASTDRIISQSIIDAYYRSCLHAGIKIQSADSKLTFQIGPYVGIKIADDLWMARYLLHRIAENFGILVTFSNAQMNVNISTKAMRDDGGIQVIERAIDKLSRIYVDRPCVSFQIPLAVKSKGRGHFQDRRPTVNADPYKLIENIIRTITFNEY